MFERLILTQRHWVLLSVVTGNGPSVHDMIRAERTDRLRVLERLTTELETAEARWSTVQSKLVVPDTNFYLQHELYFDEADWKALVSPGIHEVRVLVPIAVVRDLDKKKLAAKNITVSDTNGEPQRTRARVTSRRLRELFDKPNEVARLFPHSTEIELLLDPLGRRPVDDPDTEIIERALAAKRFSGKDVTIVTGDNGMKFQAQIEGLEVVSI